MVNATWLDSEALELDSDDDNDMWHVVIAPGEVKTVTLEQLDDFFRLDVIGVSTQVWGPDMHAWTTLGEALGVGDDGDDDDEISVVSDELVVSRNPHDHLTPQAVALPPPAWPPSGARANAGLPRLVAVPETDERPRSFSPPPKLTPYGAVTVEPSHDALTVAKAYPLPPKLTPMMPPPPAPANIPRSTVPFGVSQSPYAAPHAQSAYPSAQSAYPSAPPAAMSPYGVVTQQGPSMPPAPRLANSTMPYGGAPSQSAHARAVVADEAAGASLRPQAFDVQRRDSIRAFASDPDIYVPRPSRFGAWLMAAAILGGTAVTLYRNDVIRDFAQRAGQEAAYARLEAALGGPAFGTPRSVEGNAPKAEVASMGATSLGFTRTETKPTETDSPSRALADKATNEKPLVAEKAPEAAPKAVAVDSLPAEPAKAVAPLAKAEKAEKAEPALKREPAPAPVKAEVAPRAKATVAAAMSRPSVKQEKQEAPAPKPVAAKKAKAEADEPLPGMPTSLEDAIRDRATRKKPSKATTTESSAPVPAPKKKKSGNEYDPLNSDL
jgi:hypothetical protein